MIDKLCESLTACWTGEPGPPRTAVVVGVDATSAAKVTYLLFDARGTLCAVAKTPRRTAGEESLIREHAVLAYLRQTASPEVLARVPRPLGLLRVGGHLVLAQSPLPGRPLTASYYSRGHVSDSQAVTADFALARDWLTEFQTGTRQEPVAVSELVETWLQPLLAVYAEQVGWGAAEDDLFGAVLDRAAGLRDATVPQTGVHGDYWMGNLLVSGTRLTGVVDWELGVPTGLPVLDVFKFPTSYAANLDKTAPWGGGRVPGHPGREDPGDRWSRYGSWPNLRGFGYAYFGTGWFPELVKGYVRQLVGQLGLDPALTGVCFAGFLAEQAVHAPVPEFRDGYRTVLAAFAAERGSTWLWDEE